MMLRSRASALIAGFLVAWSASSAAAAALKTLVASGADPETEINLGFDPPQPSIDPLSTGFRTYSTAMGVLDSLDSGLVQRITPNSGTVPVQTTSVLGQDIRIYRISTAGNMRRSQPSIRKPQIVLIAGTHAREWTPMETAVRYATVLVSDYNNAPANSKTRFLLENAEIFIVPTLNVDGRLLTEEHFDQVYELDSSDLTTYSTNESLTHGRVRRKNLKDVGTTLENSWADTFDEAHLKGVDLNRNMETAWSSTATSFQDNGQPCGSVSVRPNDATYKGISASSSNEAKFTRDFLRSLDRLAAVVDIHMSAQQVYFPRVISLFPGDDRGEILDERAESLASRVAEALNTQSSLTDLTFDSTGCAPPFGSLDTFAAAGTTKLVPALTLEMGPDAAIGAAQFVRPHEEVLSSAVQAFAGLGTVGRWAARDPYLKKVLIRQNGNEGPKTIYEDEVQPGDNARNVEILESAPAVRGLVSLTLQFSMPMNPSLQPTITLSDDEDHSTSGGTGVWSATVYENDTWTGTIAIPESFTIGTVKMGVEAVDEFEGKLDGDPTTVRAWDNGDWTGYEDEEGDGSDGGADKRVSFTIIPVEDPEVAGNEIPEILNELFVVVESLGLPMMDYVAPLADGSRYLVGGAARIIKVSAEGDILLDSELNDSPVIGFAASSTSGVGYLAVTDIANPFEPTPKLYRIGPGGGPASVELPLGPGEGFSFGEGGVAVDAARNRIYVAYSVFDHAVNQFGTHVVAYDTNFNLIESKRYTPGFSDGWHGATPTGGIVVDENGDVWVTGYETPPNDIESLFVLHYGPNLSGGGAQKTATTFTESFRMYSGPKAGGGVDVVAAIGEDRDAGEVIFARGSNGALGGAFTLPGINQFNRITIGGDSFYVHKKNEDEHPLSIAKLNSATQFAWNPSYLDFYPEWMMHALAAPTTTQLHVAVLAYDPELDQDELGLLVVGPPGPPVTFNSPDDKASVVSNVPNTEIFPVPLDDELDARATVPEMGLAFASEIYEIQPSPRTLSSPATLSIDFNPEGVDMASVEIHRWNGDIWEAGPISGQTVTDNPNGTKRISGFLNTFSIYAVLYDAPSGDAAPPVTTISFSTPSFTSSGTLIAVGTRSSVTLTAEDFTTSTAPLSGLATTYYSVDAPTQPVTAYTGPFTLPAGEHTIYFYSEDVAGNTEAVSSRTVNVFDGPFVGSVSASTGPIGVPVVLRGFNFGSWSPPRTSLAFGISTAPISIWNDAQVTASVPGISSGTYDLTLTALQNGSTVAVLTGSFTVLTPEIFAVAPSSGPIGASFTLSGTAFGPYAGANTRVLLGGATTPVSVWNDSTIMATVPGVLAPGAYELAVERRTSDGGLALSNTVYFQVSELAVAALTPSMGPIGVSFTLSGSGFGAYAGANTQVLFGETAAAISVWNDATISGTVPALSTSAYAVVVKRIQGSGFQLSNVSTFTLTPLELAAPTPSSGPIGALFTLTGSGFGAYAGANTRVLLGGTTTPVSVWNDTTIKGTVPGLVPTGAQPLWIERRSGTGLQASNTVYFEVTGQGITALNPSTGPVGISFTLSGTGFGAYAGVNTQVFFGQTTAAISVWNDTTITGTIPALATGTYDAVVKRVQGAGTSLSNAVPFTLTELTLSPPVPSSAPAGAPFTLTGSGFGAYAGANTRLLLGGATVPVSVWNDTTITGTVLALTPGSQPLWIERKGTGGLQASNTVYFEILAPNVGSLSPSTGPVGIPFTISGSGFGPYGGANTQVLFGETAAPISVWNDSTIKGTVPGISTGTYDVVVRRVQGGVPSLSGVSSFSVLLPEVASMTPSSAPIGAPFTFSGTAFGPYAGANTRVKFNGIAAPISVWNDTTISGTVPGAVALGSAAVVLERAAGAFVTSSAEQSFLVLRPTVSTITPSFGPAGTVVTLTGFGFGPYAGSATKVLVGGSTVAVSVWNNGTIRWTVPSSLPDGTYPVIVVRQPAGGSVQSESVEFTVGTGYGGASFGFAAQQTSLAARPDSHFEGGLNLPSTEGGRVETPAKAAVEVPPNALDSDTEITLKRLHQDGLRSHAAETLTVRAAGEAIEFGPEGTQFATPVTIELPYDPALTADESKLAVHYYDPLRRAWEELPSEVDRARRVVRAKTAHFSIYQPMGLAPTTAAQDEFYFRDIYAFPNPSRGNAAVTFRIQPGLADTVELRVYDLSGRKIHSSSDFTFRGAIDDGNGKGAQNTYDHTWDVSGVGSGVYTYVIRASRAGQKPISKSGKAAVIK